VIDNPFHPLIPGTTRVYEQLTAEGLEHIEVHVTDRTKTILGVECVEVEDIVMLDDELIESTLDWFAQDVAGNVWYFGELSMDFEDGRVVTLDGTWEAGQDGASPGLIMPAQHSVGMLYRQEFLVGEAEDVAGFLSTSASAVVAYGSFVNCLQTEDFTALSPGSIEHKYYAAGIGKVLEIKPDSGARLELIDVIYE
jgi:hypothetical protein